MWVAVALGGTACGGPAPVDPVRSTPPVDPVTACTSSVAYWAGVDVRDGFDVGDYQQRGLSGRQNTLRQEIVDRATAAGGATDREITDQARAGCEELIAADPDPSGF